MSNLAKSLLLLQIRAESTKRAGSGSRIGSAVVVEAA